MGKIAAILPNEYLEHLTRKLVEEKGLENIEVHLGDLYQGLTIVDNSNDIDVIISRGGTADLLKKNTNIPVVYIRVHLADILKLISSAFYMKKKILFAGFDKIFEDAGTLKTLEMLIGTNIKQLNLYGLKSLSEEFKEYVVIADTVNFEIATENGLEAYLIESGEEAIMEAINNALQIQEYVNFEKKKREEILNIVNSVDFGMIYVSPEENVISNEIANKYLGNLKKNFLEKIRNQKSYEEVFSQGNEKYYVDLKSLNEGRKIITIRKAIELEKAERYIRKNLRAKGFVAKHTFEDIIGKSEMLKRVIIKAKSFAQSDANVILFGESGSGKELFAQSIHNASPRKGNPFVAINCATLPKDLLESELFGYVEGAFTGAKKEKMGLFELAHKGTLFLDEIDQIPFELQGKLLRAIEEKEILKVGGSSLVPVDTRIISATNIDPEILIRNNKLRLDLYSRLSVLLLRIPPLRERREDISELLGYFIRIFEQKYSVKVPKPDEEKIKKLMDYSWPGNVRELQNFVERITILYGTDSFEEAFCEFEDLLESDHLAINHNEPILKEIEAQLVQILIKKGNFTKTEIAKLLGVSRTYLWRKLKELGLE
ncbi:MAG TPA: AAA family ATPase [Thermotogaceae bacterium]|nr:AAA family ATPase [Thermotogaceae bacterium]